MHKVTNVYGCPKVVLLADNRSVVLFAGGSVESELKTDAGPVVEHWIRVGSLKVQTDDAAEAPAEVAEYEARPRGRVRGA